MTTNVAATGGKFVYLYDIESIYDIFDIDFTSDEDSDGIPDYYEQKIIDGVLRLGDGTTIDGLKMGNPDTDGDGLKDGEELEIRVIDSSAIKDNEQIVYVRMHSHPTMMDTDGDGYIDSEDDRPTMWDVSDRDLAMLAQASYYNYPNEERFIQTYNEPGWWFIDSKFASMDELIGWEMIDDDDRFEFYGATYKKDDNIVIAFRGSEVETLSDFIGDWFFSNFLGIFLTGVNYQSFLAREYITTKLSQYGITEHTKIYITGHSLGGYLSQQATVQLITDGKFDNNLMSAANFNAPGIFVPGSIVNMVSQLEFLLLVENSEKILNYRISSSEFPYGDVVSILGLHAGKVNHISNGDESMSYSYPSWIMNLSKAHMMSNFVESPSFSLYDRGISKTS